MSGGSVLPRRQTCLSGGPVNLVLPRPQKMHPSAKKGHVNQQAASFQRPPKRPAQVVLLSLDWARNAPYYLDKVRVREGAVGPSFSQTTSSRVQRDLKNEKAKTKASDPIQRRIAKGNERPPDHQARRRSRKETHPFPSSATRRGESYWPARRKTQWMRTARKVKHRKRVPPMRKNRPEQKTTKKT